MLVLSRKAGEQIRIGTDIIVTVLDVRGGRVRLGIEAPSEVPVHRQEVLSRLEFEVIDDHSAADCGRSRFDSRGTEVCVG